MGCWDRKGNSPFPAFLAAVSGVVFHDGLTLAAASHDRTVRLWSIATGNEERRFSYKTLVNCIALGPDGKTLALSEHTAIQVLELDTGKEIWRASAPAGDSFVRLPTRQTGKR